MKLEQVVYKTIPPDRYEAEVIEVTGEDGQYGQFVKMVFEIVEGEHAGVNITGCASAKFSTRSKLYRWVRALFGGKPIPTTYDLDTGHLVGRRCVLGVEVYTDNEGTEFNRVESIYPARTAEPVSEPAPVAQTSTLPF